MERIRYTLKHPIEYETTGEGGAKTTHRIPELQLAPRVKGRHMKATDLARGPVEAKLLLIAALAGITRMEADELDQVDLEAIDALYDEGADPLAPGAGLSTDGQAIGGTSSGT